MPNEQEEHAAEVEFAVWRMYKRGIDPKAIAIKLKDCEIIVSRKFINLAIKRCTVLEREATTLPMTIEEPAGIENLSQHLEEQKSIDVFMHETTINHTVHASTSSVGGMAMEEVEETSTEANHVPLGDSSVDESTLTNGVGPTQVATNVEIHADQSDDDLDMSSSKKPRRIKTTDDLIRRLQDDFKEFPETKVKERAAKFGIAVGTLCQIKHNILKMPKESGRTWKSTPQMVEDIAADMRLEPNMKVKERAQKFGISVGTLCRIMHDILELPKRQVQRSGERRAPKKVNKLDMGSILDPMTLASIREEAGRLALAKSSRKPRTPRRVQDGVSPIAIKSSGAPQLCQMQLKNEANGQVLFLTFDPSSSSQLSADVSGAIPISVANMAGTDEVIWVVNSGPEAEAAQTIRVSSSPDNPNTVVINTTEESK